ncbi:MAG: sugar transferase [Planctomycetes bacterium]|nr:sugar transferase [Planctomycetota bacterium]
MRRSNQVRHARTLLDLFCVVGALFVGGLGVAHDETGWRHTATVLTHVGVFASVWLLVSSRLGTASFPVRLSRRLALQRMLEAWAVTWGVSGLVVVSSFAQPHLEIWTVLVAGLLLLGLQRLVLSSTPLDVAGDRPRTLVLGACPSARSLCSGVEAQAAMEFVGFVPFDGENAQEMPHLPALGTTAGLAETLREQQIDLALVSPSDQALTGEVHRVFRTCDDMGLGIQYFPSFLDLQHLRVGLAWNASRAGLSLNTPSNHSLSRLVKRSIDFVGASIGLIALLPVFATCATAVKLSSKGPVFYRQTRVGKNGQTFNCLKFRTMRVGAHAQQEQLRGASTQDGPAFKIPDDPRITNVGRVLRKFSLDELPQLLNVWLGDMSLVGPRPPIPTEVEKYTWWQRRRISVKPGLTCVWQVWGRNRVSFKRWVEMDLYYIDNWSLWLDIKLILHTFRVVLRGTGM